jgi:preprotein translocase subunit SecF
VDFFRRQRWDIIGKTGLWFSISGVILLAGILAWTFHGLNYGIDFTGGSLVRYQLAKPIATTPDEETKAVATLRQALESIGIAQAEIQVESGNGFLIKTYKVANDEEAAQRDTAIEGKITEIWGAQYGPVEPLGRETVGPVIGEEMRWTAIKGIIVGEALILLWIAIRYEFKFGVAAILALAHDVVATTGMMALLHVELNSWFVAVLLTVVGYSVNDTVVIFDRIRENRGRHRHAPFAPIVNASLLETMARSLNTVLTVVYTLLALLFFGGTVVHGFALAMLIGVSFGCYSSIFIAAPLVVWFERLGARRKVGASVGSSRPAIATVGGMTIAPEEVDEEGAAASGGRAKVSAVDTMRRAAEAAQEEKRRIRRERRTKKRGAGSKPGAPGKGR